jgi:hypothetical protein
MDGIAAALLSPASGPDTTPPDTSITAQPGNPSNVTGPSFSFTATEAGTFECSLDAAAFSACTSPKAYTGLTAGSHTFQVRAIDTALNVDATPASYTWTIDTTAPNTTIDSSTTNGTTALPTSPAYTNVQTAAFAFSSTEPSGATFQCRLDTPAGNGTYATCTTPKSYTATNINAAGAYTFRVRASDAAGNQDASAATFAWNVDNAAPANVNLSSPTAGPVRGSITLTSGATDSGGSLLRGVQFKLDGANLQAEDTTSPYTITWDTTTATAGSHTLSAVATDNAGNTTTASNVVVTVDNLNPTGSLTAPLASANVRGNAVNLTASSADGGSGVASAKFQRSPAGGNTWTDIATDSSATGGYTATWDTTAVTDGLYDLRVITADNAGNTFTSPLVTNVRVDNTAPTSVTVSAPSSYVRGSVNLTSTMTDTGSSIASAKFQSSPTGANTWTDIATVSGAPFNTTWNTTGLNAVYDLRVIATDNAGNATTSPTVTVTVDNTNPTTAQITAPSNGFTGDSAAVTLSANAGDNAGGSGVASVQFKLGGLDQGPALTTAPYSTSWDPSTLGDGDYQLTAVVTDKAGNQLTSAAITVHVNHATPPAQDTTPPPTAPTLAVNGSPTTTTISLSWNSVSDNPGGTGISGYKLYRATSLNGSYTLVQTIIGLTSYTDGSVTPLTPGTSYYYKITAIDNAPNTNTPPGPNESAQSSALTTATAATPAPTVSFTASPTSVTSGSSATLSWTTANATTCAASASPSTSSWTGSKATGASKSQSLTSLTTTTTYTLTCQNGNGGPTTVKTASVTVTAASGGGGTPTPPAGKQCDLNGDNAVNIYDLSIFLSRYGSTNSAADFNHSGSVDIIDLSTLLSAYGK